MSIQIIYSKKILNKTKSNLVLFSDDKFNVKSLSNYLSKSELTYIHDLLKTSNLKKKIFLVSIKNDLKSSDIENLGSNFFGRVNSDKNSEYNIISDSINCKYDNFLGHFLHGIKLKSYEFKKYKSKKEKRIITLSVYGNKNQPSEKTKQKFKAL